MKTIVSVFILALFASPVSASLITLNSGESFAFNFDASALVPYAGVGVEWEFEDYEIGPGTDSVGGEFFSSFDGMGTSPASVTIFDIGNPLDAFFTDFLEGPFPGAVLLDGEFSFVVTALAGTFSVGVTGLIYDLNGAVSRLDPVSQVPVPATFALLGLGLLAIRLRQKS